MMTSNRKMTPRKKKIEPRLDGADTRTLLPNFYAIYVILVEILK